MPNAVRTCHCCGLAQWMPETTPRGMKIACTRCHTRLARPAAQIRSGQHTAALALAALLVYPFAVGLPIIEVEQLGVSRSASILDGIASLLGNGQILVGGIILLCSVILPLGKLLALFVLSAGGFLLRDRHRSLTYHLVEWTGRWGMLDVLLVALLVAVLKLGDIVEVSAGPAAIAFSALVILSLLASASFDPHRLWRGATT